MNLKQPFCIGIAGPSCSGKTTVARRLAALLPGETTLFGLDSYYHDLSHLPYQERKKFNFDHPEALEDQMLAAHLHALSRGETIQRPVYDFPTHTRLQNHFEEITPGDFLVVEGLFTLYWPEVRSIFDVTAFLGAPDPVCLERRKVRDIAERGRTVEFVLTQYRETVRPGSENFILPTRAFAGLVISGEQLTELTAQQILEAVQQRMAAKTE
jgi:uridine kinase